MRILSVKDNEAHVVRFLGEYAGTLLHYKPKVFTPCKGPRCPLAIHCSQKTVWKGWAPVEQLEDATGLWWCAALEVTENMEEQLRGRRLRGEVWAITRPKVKEVGNPVVAMYLEKHRLDGLRLPFDVLPVVQRVYRTLEIELGAANPVPPKLVLGPADGEKPAALQRTAEEEAKPMTEEQATWFREKLRAFQRKQGVPVEGRNGAAGKGVQHG